MKAPEVPPESELSADVGAKVDDVTADVAAKVDDVSADVSAKADDVVAKAPGMPSTEVSLFSPAVSRLPR